jgi:hypothetical protein
MRSKNPMAAPPTTTRRRARRETYRKPDGVKSARAVLMARAPTTAVGRGGHKCTPSEPAIAAAARG